MKSIFRPSVTSLLAVMIILSPFIHPEAMVPASAHTMAGGEIVLVAGDTIDMMWDPSQYPDPGLKFLRWELYRGPAENALTLHTHSNDSKSNFYRDQELIPGLVYYRLDIIRCVSPCDKPQDERRYTIFTDSATAGLFQGFVKRDLTLVKGAYEIGFAGVGSSAGVVVTDSAVLTIPAGVILKPAAGVSHASLSADQGYLHIDGAQFETSGVTFGDYYDESSWGKGYVRNTVFKEGHLSLNGLSQVDVRGNRGQFSIYLDHQSNALIANNVIEGSIHIENQAQASIEKNEITNGDIKVSGYGAASQPKARALIVENTLTTAYKNQGVRLSYGAHAKLTGNQIEWTEFHGSESTVLISASDEGTGLTMERNLISNGKLGVFWGSTITVTENVFNGGGAAISIGCVVCGSATQAQGIVERNTIQNGWGFEMWEGSQALTVRHNCIRSNDPGLTTDDAFMSSPVDFRDNYWGHESGPQHPTNPGGKGDPIQGDKVLFDPWYRYDSYCQDAPDEPLPDVRFAGLEVVQAVQDLENSIPLVADKAALLRAYIESRTGMVGTVKWQLSAFRDGALLGTRQGYTSASQITSLDAERSRSWSGVSVSLPEEWLSGVVDIWVELNPDRSFSETTYANNTIHHTLTFLKRKEFNVGYFPISYQPDPSQPAETPPSWVYPSLGVVVNQAYPTPLLRYSPNSIPLKVPLKMKGSPQEGERALMILNNLSKSLLRINQRRAAQERLDQIVGIFPGGDFENISYCISDPPFDNGEGYASYCHANASTIAHELAHNYNLRHTNTKDSGGAVDPDTDWPYPDGTIQEYGFNVGLFNLIPKTTSDLMTYNEPVWISPFHYLKLFDALAPLGTVRSSQAETTYLVASGLVYKDGRVEIDPLVWLEDTQPPAETPVGSQYCLDQRDSGGGTLSSRCFDLSFKNTQTQEDMTVDSYLLAVPHAAGMSQVVIRQGSQDLGGVTASDNPPAVTLISPNGGENLEQEITLSWTASDIDGDHLSYNLLYSPDDGLSWSPIALEITGTTSYTGDFSLVPGSDSARIKVEASDGFHLSSDQSDGVLSVEDRSPIAGIISPEDGDTLLSTSGYLFGGGYDPEEGELSGESLSWSSDREGALGTGSRLSAASLSEGAHTLTLTAADSHGNLGAHSISVQVVVPNLVYLPMVRR